jgi:hypothetical protein
MSKITKRNVEGTVISFCWCGIRDGQKKYFGWIRAIGGIVLFSDESLNISPEELSKGDLVCFDWLDYSFPIALNVRRISQNVRRR